MTLRIHDLPEFFGTANFKIGARSEDAYRQLIHEFVSFYRTNIFNQQWGELVRLRSDNTLQISMLPNGLDANLMKQVWQPFLDWVRHSSGYSLKWPVVIASLPALHFWDIKWWQEHWLELGLPNHEILDHVLAHLLTQSS